MVKRIRRLSYANLILSALIGLGEILAYLILNDNDMASITIAALVVSVAFSIISIVKKNPHFLIGSMLPYLFLSLFFLFSNFTDHPHWIFYIYDVGVIILLINYILAIVYRHKLKKQIDNSKDNK